jgi:hypothetical protein
VRRSVGRGPGGGPLVRRCRSIINAAPGEGALVPASCRETLVWQVVGACTLLILLASCSQRRLRVFRDAGDDSGVMPNLDGGIDADRAGALDDIAAPDVSPLACMGVPAGGVENAACNDIVPAGPCVEQIQIDDSAAAPAGGPLVEGTYDLTERILYTNPGGATGPIGNPKQETLVLSAVGPAWVLTVGSRSADGNRRQTKAVTVLGSTLAFIVVCPPPGATDGGAADADSGNDADSEKDDADGSDNADLSIPGQADAVSDGNSPDHVAGNGSGSVGGGDYYTASDRTLTLYGLSATGPVRADTYTLR